MSNEIATLRQALGWSWLQLAERLGVHRTTVMRWELTERKPPPYIDAALREIAIEHELTWPPAESEAAA